jgi:hypothetical protein
VNTAVPVVDDLRGSVRQSRPGAATTVGAGILGVWGHYLLSASTRRSISSSTLPVLGSLFGQLVAELGLGPAFVAFAGLLVSPSGLLALGLAGLTGQLLLGLFQCCPLGLLSLFTHDGTGRLGLSRAGSLADSVFSRTTPDRDHDDTAQQEQGSAHLSSYPGALDTAARIGTGRRPMGGDDARRGQGGIAVRQVLPDVRAAGPDVQVGGTYTVTSLGRSVILRTNRCLRAISPLQPCSRGPDRVLAGSLTVYSRPAAR